MKLLSVNVAMPKEVTFDGERVLTGIFKKPVTGPVRVGALNLEGDRQGDLTVHGGPFKAVYVYPCENVEHWRKELRRDDLREGSFGENLTVAGLSETEVAIGDELEIGSARFQVTQPRIPCFKLAGALGIPEMPKIFLESGRTGFYLRVLREGSINAGDSISTSRVEASQRVTVAQFAEIYRTRRATEKQISRILSLPSLSPSMRAWMEQKTRTAS